VGAQVWEGALTHWESPVSWTRARAGLGALSLFTGARLVEVPARRNRGGGGAGGGGPKGRGECVSNPAEDARAKKANLLSLPRAAKSLSTAPLQPHPVVERSTAHSSIPSLAAAPKGRAPAVYGPFLSPLSCFFCPLLRAAAGTRYVQLLDDDFWGAPTMELYQFPPGMTVRPSPRPVRRRDVGFAAEASAAATSPQAASSSGTRSRSRSPSPPPSPSSPSSQSPAAAASSSSSPYFTASGAAAAAAAASRPRTRAGSDGLTGMAVPSHHGGGSSHVSHETGRQTRMRQIAAGNGLAAVGAASAHGAALLSRPSPRSFLDTHAPQRALLRLPLVGIASGGDAGASPLASTSASQAGAGPVAWAGPDGRLWYPPPKSAPEASRRGSPPLHDDEGGGGGGGGGLDWEGGRTLQPSPLTVGGAGAGRRSPYGGAGAGEGAVSGVGFLSGTFSFADLRGGGGGGGGRSSPGAAGGSAAASATASASASPPLRPSSPSSPTTFAPASSPPLYAERTAFLSARAGAGARLATSPITGGSPGRASTAAGGDRRVVGAGVVAGGSSGAAAAAAAAADRDEEEDEELAALIHGSGSTLQSALSWADETAVLSARGTLLMAPGGAQRASARGSPSPSSSPSPASSLSASFAATSAAAAAAAQQQQLQLGPARAELLAAHSILSPEQRRQARSIRALFAPSLFSDLLECYRFFASERVPSFALAVWSIAAGVFKDALASSSAAAAAPGAVPGTAAAAASPVYARDAAATLSRCVAGTYAVGTGPLPTVHGPWAMSKVALQFAVRVTAAQGHLRTVLDAAAGACSKVIERAAVIASQMAAHGGGGGGGDGQSSPTSPSPSSSPSPTPATGRRSPSSPQQSQQAQAQQQQLPSMSISPLGSSPVGLRFDPRSKKSRPPSLSLSPLGGSETAGAGGGGLAAADRGASSSPDVQGFDASFDPFASVVPTRRQTASSSSSSGSPTHYSAADVAAAAALSATGFRLPAMPSPGRERLFTRGSAPLASTSDMAVSSLAVPSPPKCALDGSQAGSVPAAVFRASSLAPHLRVITAQGIQEGDSLRVQRGNNAARSPRAGGGGGQQRITGGALGREADWREAEGDRARPSTSSSAAMGGTARPSSPDARTVLGGARLCAVSTRRAFGGGPDSYFPAGVQSLSTSPVSMPGVSKPAPPALSQSRVIALPAYGEGAGAGAGAGGSSPSALPSLLGSPVPAYVVDRAAAEKGLVRARTAYADLDRLLALSKRMP
jgi:hypothetical protein